MLKKRGNLIYPLMFTLLAIIALSLILRPLLNPRELLNAAESGDVNKVKQLLDKGVDVNTKDEWSGTPIMYAAANGHTGVVALLIERGGGVNSISRLDRTPLMWAANRGRDETVLFLLQKGADVNPKDREGKTALMLALERNHYSTAAILEEQTKLKAKPSEPSIK